MHFDFTLSMRGPIILDWRMRLRIACDRSGKKRVPPSGKKCRCCSPRTACLAAPFRLQRPPVNQAIPIQMRSQKAEKISPASTSSGPVRPTVEERSYALPPGASSGPDPYAIETKHTAALVAERLLPDGLTSRDWYFAFQSQGMSGGPWIGPTVEETLECLHREGHRGVVLQPIGFLCDHVEILYDIDIAFQATARKLGLKLFRPESLNASPLLIAALADLASQGLLQLGAAQIEGSSVVVASNQK